jgi:hypothetical protein
MHFNYRGFSTAIVIVSCLTAANADSLSLNVSDYYNAFQSAFPFQNPLNPGPLTATLSQTDVLGAGVGYGTSTGTADYGVLKGGTDIFVTNQSTTVLHNSESGYGTASWSSVVNPTGAAGAGITASLSIDGLVDSMVTPGLPGGFSENAYFRLTVGFTQVGGFVSDSDTLTGSTVDGVYTGPPLPSTWTTKEFMLDFTQSYTESVSLSWSNQVNQSGIYTPLPWSQSSEVDISHTIIWKGSKAYDAIGNQISDYHLTGQGGRDWAKPAAVPEPTTLFAMGTGAVFLLRRKHRKS